MCPNGMPSVKLKNKEQEKRKRELLFLGSFQFPVF
jgi:hypothetical protein